MGWEEEALINSKPRDERNASVAASSSTSSSLLGEELGILTASDTSGSHPVNFP
jgi:hypothetical protein